MLYIITLDNKPATVQQLHKNEGWTYKPKEFESELHTEGYISAPTARDCRLAYEAALGIAWTQKQSNVRTQKLSGGRNHAK